MSQEVKYLPTLFLFANVIIKEAYEIIWNYSVATWLPWGLEMPIKLCGTLGRSLCTSLYSILSCHILCYDLETNNREHQQHSEEWIRDQLCSSSNDLQLEASLCFPSSHISGCNT